MLMCECVIVNVMYGCEEEKEDRKEKQVFEESHAYFLVYSECTRSGLGEILCIKNYFHTQQGLRQTFLIIVTLRKKGYHFSGPRIFSSFRLYKTD